MMLKTSITILIISPSYHLFFCKGKKKASQTARFFKKNHFLSFPSPLLLIPSPVERGRGEVFPLLIYLQKVRSEIGYTGRTNRL
jgi:hypothetical protein